MIKTLFEGKTASAIYADRAITLTLKNDEKFCYRPVVRLCFVNDRPSEAGNYTVFARSEHPVVRDGEFVYDDNGEVKKFERSHKLYVNLDEKTADDWRKTTKKGKDGKTHSKIHFTFSSKKVWAEHKRNEKDVDYTKDGKHYDSINKDEVTCVYVVDASAIKLC